MNVRVRFAPSPSGDLHVGNARTALFNWLFARQQGGKFIFRIEDTDASRSTNEAIQAIEESLRWLGLDWDEGPSVGGAHAPYRQSQRGEQYRQVAETLLAAGKAYWCFSSPEELEEERKQFLNTRKKVPHSDRFLSQEQRQAKVAQGRKPSLRFIAPDEDREIAFHDLVRGEVRFHLNEINDFNLMKSDGSPMYNFAVVVDDHAMQVSHVLRGEDGISNTPRQLLLYEALGWQAPHFGHVSFILGHDHSKLSKSHGDTSIGDFRKKGYLPEALVNYLGLLGLGGHGEGSEILSRQQLMEMFSFDRLVKNPAVFDYGKLHYLNGHYLRSLPSETLFSMVKPYLQEAGMEGPEEWLKELVQLVKAKAQLLSEFPQELRMFFQAPDLSQAVTKQFLGLASAQKAVSALAKTLASEAFPKDAESCKTVFKKAQQESEIKGKDFFMPVRVALSGEEHGAELVHLLPLLGPEKAKQRLEAFIKASQSTSLAG